MSKDELTKLFKKHITKTKYKQFVYISDISIGNIPATVKTQIGIYATRVHITSIALKHIYDKHIYKNHLSEEFNFVFENMRKVIQNPDFVITNKPNRRADFCFIKTISQKTIICTLQIVNKKLYIVTAFVLKDRGYIKGTKVIWKF